MSENHRVVQQTVSRSPSVSRLRSEKGLSKVSHSAGETSRKDSSNHEQTVNQPEQDEVGSSYRQDQAIISAIRTQADKEAKPQSSTLERETKKADSDASVIGLAPSTVASELDEDIDFSPLDDMLEKRSVISGISVSSLTKQWLESQLSPEETKETLSKMKFIATSVAGDEEEDSFSIRAPDTETFLENIQYFMPRMTDFNMDQYAFDDVAEEGKVSATESHVTEEASIWSRMPDEDSYSLLIVAQSGTIPIQHSVKGDDAQKARTEDDTATGKVARPPKGAEETSGESSYQEFRDLPCPAQGPGPPEILAYASPIPSTSYNVSGLQTAGPSASKPEKSVLEEGTRIAQPKLPAIPSIYAERHSWEHGKEPSPFDPQPTPRIRYHFSQALTPAETQEGDPSPGRDGYKLPPIRVYSLYGYGNRYISKR